MKTKYLRNRTLVVMWRAMMAQPKAKIRSTSIIIGFPNTLTMEFIIMGERGGCVQRISSPKTMMVL